VPDLGRFSPQLLANEEAKSPEALRRIAIAKQRIQLILDREVVSHQKTLEKKIADQGPTPQRVDPHLIGLAIFDLRNLGRLRETTHPATGTTSWYSNLLTEQAMIAERLDELAPLYASVSAGGFGNLTGDALEVIVYKCLDKIAAAKPRYTYQGHFELDKPKDKHGRYRKVQPPKAVAGHSTAKEADFLQFGYEAGPLAIECKNYREWIYPHHGVIKETIVKAYELGCLPVLVARRFHYTTMTNLLRPGGILAHEALFQYYPADQAELAERVRDKTKLGFTDVLASEEPHARTEKFFSSDLPKVAEMMAAAWGANRDALYAYARDQMNLAQLYTEIGSPAGGKWQNFGKE